MCKGKHIITLIETWSIFSITGIIKKVVISILTYYSLFTRICSINRGNGSGHFFQALSKHREECARIFRILQKFGVATWGSLLQTPNTRPRRRILQVHFERAPERNTKILIPIRRNAPIY